MIVYIIPVPKVLIQILCSITLSFSKGVILMIIMYNHCTVHIYIALCKHLYYLNCTAYLCHSSAHLVVVLVVLYNYGI